VSSVLRLWRYKGRGEIRFGGTADPRLLALAEGDQEIDGPRAIYLLFDGQQSSGCHAACPHAEL